jgi:hypothetical protein
VRQPHAEQLILAALSQPTRRIGRALAAVAAVPVRSQASGARSSEYYGDPSPAVSRATGASGAIGFLDSTDPLV